MNELNGSFYGGHRVFSWWWWWWPWCWLEVRLVSAPLPPPRWISRHIVVTHGQLRRRHMVVTSLKADAFCLSFLLILPFLFSPFDKNKTPSLFTFTAPWKRWKKAAGPQAGRCLFPHSPLPPGVYMPSFIFFVTHPVHSRRCLHNPGRSFTYRSSTDRSSTYR